MPFVFFFPFSALPYIRSGAHIWCIHQSIDYCEIAKCTFEWNEGREREREEERENKCNEITYVCVGKEIHDHCNLSFCSFHMAWVACTFAAWIIINSQSSKVLLQMLGLKSPTRFPTQWKWTDHRDNVEFQFTKYMTFEVHWIEIVPLGWTAFFLNLITSFSSTRNEFYVCWSDQRSIFSAL